MSTLWQDLRYSFRMLWKKPGFMVIAVITLSLGIGANTTIFSVVKALILSSPQIADANNVGTIWRSTKEKREEGYVSYLDLQDWRAQNRSFEAIAGYKPNGFVVMTDGQAERIPGMRVTANFLSLLKVGLVRGRDFRDEEEKRGADRVVILSHKYWQDRLGASEDAVGTQIELDGRPFTIIGILPPGFEFPLAPDNTELLTSVSGEAGNLSERGAQVLKAISRLKSGISFTQGQADLNNIAANVAAQYPQYNKDIVVYLVRLDEHIVGNEIRRALWLLLAAVGFLLLIACTNVSNLLLVRAGARQRELALRIALGAGTGRIARHLLIESLMLALASGAAGVLIAMWGLSAIRFFGADQLPRIDEVRIDAWVLSFTLTASLLTAVLFSLIPILKASRPNVNEVLKAGTKNIAGGTAVRFWRDSLVVAEVALGLVLLIGAGLMIHSFRLLVNVDPGFDPKNVLSGRIGMVRTVYEDSDERVRYVNSTLDKLRTLPGVESAAFVAPMPFSGGNVSSDFRIDEQPEPAPGELPVASNRSVTSQYFQSMRIPLLKGRYFTEQDQRRGVGVAIINAALASRYFANEDPIGKHISNIGANQDEGDPKVWEIVGVVGNVHHSSLTRAAAPELYLPYQQNSWSWGSFFVRTSNEPSGLLQRFAEEIRSSDRSVVLTNVQPLTQAISKTISETRFYTLLFALFGITGLVLTLTGIYGVISYIVSQHTQEIGIRIALGAKTSDVLKLVLKHGMALTAAGIVIGGVAAAGLTRFMAMMLFGIHPTDPVTFIGITAMVVLMALLACWIPARRATKVDPMIALHYE